MAAALVVTLLLLNQPRALSVLAVAGLLLLSRRMHTRPMLALVDWHLITLFCGLFIVVRGVHLTGLPAEGVARLAERGLALANPYQLSLVTVALSNLVSNVPATLLLASYLEGAPDTLAYVLSLSATYAGNLLTIGSLANLIVIEQAKSRGVSIGFMDYARSGLIVTGVNLLVLFGWIALVG